MRGEVEMVSVWGGGTLREAAESGRAVFGKNKSEHSLVNNAVDVRKRRLLPRESSSRRYYKQRDFTRTLLIVDAPLTTRER